MPVSLKKVCAVLTALVSMLLGGCQTSTVETRKVEKASAYEQLDPALRALVDSGQIKVGMPADAVYIAWGAPAQILQSEDATGAITTWLYEGTYLQEHRYWNYREVSLRDGIFLERYLDTEYNPQSYWSAEITFVNGIVQRWRTLPRPQ